MDVSKLKVELSRQNSRLQIIKGIDVSYETLAPSNCSNRPCSFNFFLCNGLFVYFRVCRRASLGIRFSLFYLCGLGLVISRCTGRPLACCN